MKSIERRVLALEQRVIHVKPVEILPLFERARRILHVLSLGVKAREQLAEKMSPEQIADAQRLAREWKPQTWDELKKGLERKSR